MHGAVYHHQHRIQDHKWRTYALHETLLVHAGLWTYTQEAAHNITLLRGR